MNNEDYARQLCCSGCNNYVCYTNKKRCQEFENLLTMAKWKDEQAMYDSLCFEELKKCNKLYQEFIKYLYEDCAGSKDLILRAITDNSYNNEYVGYVVTENSIDSNGNLILTFKVNDNTYKAHWQQSDNYACCQWTGYSEDDYKGYLLFPTYDFNKFFCIYYEC